MSPAIPELVFELLPEHRIVVLCEGRGEPSTQEWDGYLGLLRQQLRSGGLRVFVYSAGGRPSRAQQQQLMQLTGDHDLQVAVVSASMALRFVVSVFALIHRDIRLFTPAQLDQAFAHIRCSAEEVAAVRAAVERLKRVLEVRQSATGESRV